MKDSLKYCVQGTVIVCLADEECSAVVTFCPRSVLLMVFISVLNNGLGRAVCKGLKAPVGFGHCGG